MKSNLFLLLAPTASNSVGKHFTSKVFFPRLHAGLTFSAEKKFPREGAEEDEDKLVYAIVITIGRSEELIENDLYMCTHTDEYLMHIESILRRDTAAEQAIRRARTIEETIKS